MPINKWISIRAVLNSLAEVVPAENWNESVMIEYCARAMGMIGIVSQYENIVKFLTVVDHRAMLPAGLLQVYQIAYKENFLFTQDDVDEIKIFLGIDNEPYMQNSNLPVQFINSQYYYDYWRPLRLSTSSFAKSVHCTDCINLVCETEHNYSVNVDGTLTTSFKDGYLCLSYFSYPMDEEGDFMIPDNDYYIEALRNYCMYMYWEKRWNMKEEGAERRYLHYQQKWGFYKKNALADTRLPDVATADNLNNIAIRLIPKTRRFNSFFGNLGSAEMISERGFSSNQNFF